LLSNYLLDTTGQADRDELESVRSDIRMYENLAAFTKDLIKKLITRPERRLTAQEALQAGLVEKVVAPARLDGAVAAWTDAIGTAGPLAIRAQKALMRRWETQNVDQAIESGVTAFREAFGSDEPQRKLHEVLAISFGDIVADGQYN